MDILCVGHATYDISVFVDGFPPENSKCETHELMESGGGPAANAAYLLSLWGHRCGFAGLIGKDGYGERIAEEFRSVGTDISLLEMRAGHATPVSIIVINKPTGSRTIINRKAGGASLQIEASALAMESPRALLFDGHELEASLAALRAFPEAISMLDAGSWREGTAALAGKVDYLAASERFALQATGLRNLESEANRRDCIAKLRDLSSKTIVVTLGEHGLIADDGTGFRHIPARPAKAVDTTGAGDIFHGALLHALLEAIPFPDALRFASIAASLSVQKAGCRASIPSLTQVKDELCRPG